MIFLKVNKPKIVKAILRGKYYFNHGIYLFFTKINFLVKLNFQKRTLTPGIPEICRTLLFT